MSQFWEALHLAHTQGEGNYFPPVEERGIQKIVNISKGPQTFTAGLMPFIGYIIIKFVLVFTVLRFWLRLQTGSHCDTMKVLKLEKMLVFLPAVQIIHLSTVLLATANVNCIYIIYSIISGFHFQQEEFIARKTQPLVIKTFPCKLCSLLYLLFSFDLPISDYINFIVHKHNVEEMLLLQLCFAFFCDTRKWSSLVLIFK